MAIIDKIRERSGWAIGFIAVGLGIFVLGGDLFKPNSVNPSKRIIGEIAGEKIKLEDFNTELEIIKANYTLQRNTSPREVEIPFLREQAWNELVNKVAYQKQYDILGLQVPEKELIDMVQGNNIHPGIASSFTDSTGKVNREYIRIFLQNINSYPIEQQISYYNFERRLGPERLKNKYEGLFRNTIYFTQAEAKREYELENTKANFQYVYIPYSSIADTEVNPTESQLEDYYYLHKEQYKREASISLEYVSFPVNYTDEDERAILKETENLIPFFESTQNDSAFVDANSDNENNFKIVSHGELPPIIISEYISIGKVYGPIKEGERYKIYKLISQKEDTLYSARASHILFDTKNQNEQEKRKIKAEAENILRKIKKGIDFAEMARKYGSDGTKDKGGDLGWFREGDMVPPFNDAVMKQNKRRLVPNIIETQFGYHIIKVTETKTKDAYLLASVEKEILPGDETINTAYKKISKFARTISNYEDFTTAVEKDSTLILFSASNISLEARSINNISGSEARQIIIWAYTDAEKGDVSSIFEFEDQFLIATLTDKKKEGINTFEEVRNEIVTKINNQLKRKKILKKLDSIEMTDINAIALAYGDGAKINLVTDLSMNALSIQGIGLSPTLIGKIFTVQQGTISKPFYDEENGIIIVEMQQLDKPLEVKEYTPYKNDIEESNKYQVSRKINKAIEQLEGIKKELYKFY